MTLHCASRFLPIVLLGWAAFAAEAFAQGAPTPLFPPPKAPAASPPTAAPPPSPSPGEAVIDGIRVDELGPVQPQSDSIGTIEGFGPDIWRGTVRSALTTYLPRTPAPILSPALRSLTRRLLLTSATAPPATPGTSAASLAALRLDRLAALGDADDYMALANALPDTGDEASVRSRMNAALLASDNDQACAELDRGRSFQGEFWTRAATFCDIARGRTAQAQLALDMLGEQGAPSNSPFPAVLRAALGERSRPIADLAGIGPLEAALLRRTQADVAPGALATASPLALRALALGSGPLAVRLEAAERAEAIGAISTDKLAELYMSAPFKKEEIANALSTAAGETSSRGWALFYRSEETQQVPAAKAEAIKAAFTAALGSSRDPWRSGQTARLYAKAVAAIDPVPELAWFSIDAARLLYIDGNIARAEEWRALAQRDSESAAAAVALWPLAAISAVPVDDTVTLTDATGTPFLQSQPAKPFDAAGFKAWLATLNEPDRAAKGAVALTLLDSLGVGIPPETWAPFLDASSTVGRSSPLLGPLARAAGSGRVGETVLLGLTALGSGEPDKWPLETVAAFDAALVRVKLGTDARSLAMEASTGAGL